MYCTLAELDKGKLNAVKDLEKQTGKTILAWSCAELKPAGLDQGTLAELQEAEKKTGLVLLAVE